MIQKEFDQDIRDNHRLNLQHYNNQLWRLSGNLLILEEEFDRIRNNVLYEISIIDTLLGNWNEYINQFDGISTWD